MSEQETEKKPRPRRTRKQFDEQVYKLPQYGSATVTIRYEADNAPPFYQPAAGVVIIGEHVCAPQPAFAPPPVARAEAPRGGNLMDTDDPRYEQMRSNLASFEPREKKVVTSEDVWAEMTGQALPPGALSAEALAVQAQRSAPVTDEG